MCLNVRLSRLSDCLGEFVLVTAVSISSHSECDALSDSVMDAAARGISGCTTNESVLCDQRVLTPLITSHPLIAERVRTPTRNLCSVFWPIRRIYRS
jgi:hypothetical protein